jgi:hypothetical protein
MPITPDTKDWTWVLDRECSECGFDTRTVAREEIAAILRSNAASWNKVLTNPNVKQRPSDDVWSALEYACHVRDVFRLYNERLVLMLEQDGPHYPNWDQDAAAVESDYGSQDPAKVYSELLAAGEQLAARFDGVGDDQWRRTGFRSDGAEFTIETFARYLIHDPVHHLYDVERGFVRIGEAG